MPNYDDLGFEPIDDDLGFEPLPEKPPKKESGVDFLMRVAGLTKEFFSNPRGLAQQHPLATRTALQVAGGLAGTPIGGPIVGGGIGAGVGELAAQKVLGEEVNPKEAALAGTLSGAFGVAGRTAAALRSSPKAIRAGAALMKTSAGISEEVGRQVLKDVGILFRAKPVRAAGELIAQEADRIGLKSGTEGMEIAFGTRFIRGEDAIIEAADSVSLQIDHLGALTKEELRRLPQRALSARQMITNHLMAPKFQNPKLAMNRRELLKTVSQIDEYLGKFNKNLIPSLHGFRESMVKQAFSSLTPENANKTASVLRGIAGVGGAGYFADQGSPIGALLALSAFSPLAIGGALRLTKGVTSAGRSLPGQATLRSVLAGQAEQQP